jgi:hypothetical protein
MFMAVSGVPRDVFVSSIMESRQSFLPTESSHSGMRDQVIEKRLICINAWAVSQVLPWASVAQRVSIVAPFMTFWLLRPGVRETLSPIRACHRTDGALSVALFNHKQRGVMAKRKKKEPASQAETSVDFNVPGAPVEEPAPTVSIDASPSKDISHGGQVEQQSDQPWRSGVRDDEPDRRPSYPDPNVPFSLAHNNQVGLRFLKYDRFKQVQFAFNNSPSDEIHNQLTSEGWTYRQEEDVYTRQYGERGEAAALIDGKRTYNALVDHLLAQSGQRHGHGR